MSGMFSSGGSSTSSTSPWAAQQPSIQRTFDEANRLYSQGPAQFYPGSLVAGQNPYEKGAQTELSSYANALPGKVAGYSGSADQIQNTLNSQQSAAQNSISGAQQAAQFGLNAPDIKNNPYLGGYIDAATRPIQQNLQENTLPQLQSGSINAGQSGSSRAGIAEGLASGRASQAIGDTAAGISSNAYGQGLQAYSNALNMLPQLSGQQIALGNQTLSSLAVPQFQAGLEQNFGMLPGEIMSALGTNQRQFDQSNIDAQRQAFDFNQMAPWLNLSMLQGATSGNYGGTTNAENTIKGPENAFDPMGLFGNMFGGGGGGFGGFLGPLGGLFG